VSKKKNRKHHKGAQGRPAADSAAGPLDAQDPAAAERRAQQLKEWRERKKRKEHKKTPAAVYAWGGLAAALVVAFVAGGVLLFTGGGSDASAVPTPTPRPDPRVAGLTPERTFVVEAGDSGQERGPYFEPRIIEARAGEVIEIVMKNVGSVAHNLVIAGLDDQYGTADDWITEPPTIHPGQEGAVIVKIDEPGQYRFHCEFHPVQQTGTLILR
jgi:plastocyanin